MDDYRTGYIDGEASRDAEIKNWSACEAAANIPAVLEYVGQLEKERDQLSAEVERLKDSILRAIVNRDDGSTDWRGENEV